MDWDAWFLRRVAGPVVLLCVACAAEKQARQMQLDRARERVVSYQQYQAPEDYRAQLGRYFETVFGDTRSLAVFAVPNGAIVCGHVDAKGAVGVHAGYLPFGALFDRAGTLIWVRIFQPFQGMWTTDPSNPRPADDDVTIAVGCNIPLVF